MQQMQINDDTNDKEFLKEKNKKLSSELQNCRKERDHWKLKYEKLLNKVKIVLNNDRAFSPPPSRK